jgi:hypothetical protein
VTEDEKVFAGISIDPDDYEEPSQTWPAEIIVSEFRMASEEYCIAKLTKSPDPAKEELPQWNLQVRRLDAVRQELDGSQSDDIVYGRGFYGAIDMKRWSDRTNDGKGGLIALGPRHLKDWSILTAYKVVLGQVQPPSLLVGKKLTFEYFPIKVFNGFAARRVLYPRTVLDPGFEFTDEKFVFVAREQEDDDTPTEGTNVPATGGSTDLLSEADAMALLPGLFVGQKSDDVAGLIGVIPQNARLPVILNAVATGDLVKQLAADGKLTINTETGVIGAA